MFFGSLSDILSSSPSVLAGTEAGGTTAAAAAAFFSSRSLEYQ